MFRFMQPHHDWDTDAMRRELTDRGFQELRTPDAVDQALAEQPDGTTLLVINSVCGCAAGGARPGVAQSLQGASVPDRLLTVFAGQDKEATERAREYIHGFPPSSPAVALFKGGEVVAMLQRHDIEGYAAEAIAARLQGIYAEHCG